MFGSVPFAAAPFGAVQESDASGGTGGGNVSTIVMDQGHEATISSSVTMI